MCCPASKGFNGITLLFQSDYSIVMETIGSHSMKEQTSKNKLSNKFKLAAGIVVLLILVAAIWAVTILMGQKNYAQQAASNLEKSLISTGATRVCSTGDSGRGSDNRTPWYTVYFKSSMAQSQAKDTISTAAKNNDFNNLSQAASGTKGYLGDVVYIDESKASSNSELQPGSVDLAMALTNSGPLHPCGDEISSDGNHTIISVEIRLPNFK